ncbi:MAG: 4-oxalomesaconate tautomerase [Actinobacteria bacterium]|nr:4-oxalomesaconate tautomerase [Actinomycetota bacterium]
MNGAAGRGIRCLLMRGGTSKGAYFLAEDLPADPAERDDLLIRIMGSGDPRQIDGIGGAHPLTSKVAVVSRAANSANSANTEANAGGDGDADVDYLFLQLGVDQATVSSQQNCGNLLAAVGPFAVERGLIAAGPEQTTTRIRMVNSGSLATARFETPGGQPRYDGDTAISGVPGTAAAIVLDFTDTEGSATGSLLPTGHLRDEIDGIEVTCIDNGMPVVVTRAAGLGLTGYESHQELGADQALRDRIQSLRIQAGKLMGLGDVTSASVPKTTLVAAPRDGGTICTRTFIPVQPHTAIGVLGAVSVVTALAIPGAVGAELAGRPDGVRYDVEHPTGRLQIEAEVDTSGDTPRVRRSGVVRTARKLFDGTVFPRSH